MKQKTTFSSKKISTRKSIDSNSRMRKNAYETEKQKSITSIFGRQEIKENLQSFYDKEAKKYAETRKKFWHEEKAILNEITPLFENNGKIRVLEFGC